MDREANGQECDELDILLGEIPNATSGNPSSAESAFPADRSLVYVNHPMGLFAETNGHVHPRSNTVEQYRSPYSPSEGITVELQEPCLPDDRSLTRAFTGLSFSNAGSTKTATTKYKIADDKSNPDRRILPTAQSPISFKKPIAPMNSSPDSSLNCYDVFGVARFDQPNSNVFELKVKEHQRGGVDSCRPTKSFPGHVFSSQGTNMNCSHLSQNAPDRAPAPSPELPSQHRYLVDPQSSPLHLASGQCRQPEVTWRLVEQDRYDRVHQYYLYLQQLRNQQLEARAVQASVSAPARIVTWNPSPPFSDIPISQIPLEQSHQVPYWNRAAVSRGLNQVDYIQPASYFGRKQTAGHTFKQSTPEKFLTRRQGVTSCRPIKLSQSRVHEIPTRVNQNGGEFPNSHLRGLYNQVCDHLQPGSKQMQGSTLGGLDFKHDNLRVQLHKYSSLDELTGRIHLIAKDQFGCRFLQRKFAEGSKGDIAMVFDGIIDHIVDLMTDPFGNYLVQKLLEICDENQCMQILIAVTKKAGDLIRISCDMHGTRAVQKVIETLKTPKQSSIVVSSLKPGIVALIKNMNGNHVAQRCLQFLKPEFKEFLLEAASLNCVDLATDRHGCCVLQKCLIYSEGQQRDRLIHEITSNALVLSQDPFGNYVVQYVLELEISWATEDVLVPLENHYCDMSVQKYSSNVVEKCLKYAEEESRSRIIHELINSGRLDQIMQDPYGNYVIQAALTNSKGAAHAALVEAIRPYISMLRTSPYAKKIISKNCLKK